MALITPAQLKIAMLAVKPQPKAKGGPPARKVFGRKPVLRGSFKAASGIMPPVADEHPDEHPTSLRSTRRTTFTRFCSRSSTITRPTGFRARSAEAQAVSRRQDRLPGTLLATPPRCTATCRCLPSRQRHRRSR
jgi:hypothetical protein